MFLGYMQTEKQKYKNLRHLQRGNLWLPQRIIYIVIAFYSLSAVYEVHVVLTETQMDRIIFQISWRHKTSFSSQPSGGRDYPCQGGLAWRFPRLMLPFLWAGLGPIAMKLKGEFQYVACQHQVIVIE